MTGELLLRAAGLRKVFSRRTIFEDVSFSLSMGQILLISGRNGSGKSTLVKIICGLLTPTAGALEVGHAGAVDGAERLAMVGMVSPYLQMYDEFSASENLQVSLAIRGLPPAQARVDELLRKVALFQRRDDLVRTYSSGMKQRVKYAFALIHHPPILVLDEPMANLDAEGIEIVRAIMDEQRQDGMLVVATNDVGDIERYDTRIDLNAAHRT